MLEDNERSPSGETHDRCPAEEVLRQCLTGQLPPDQEAACSQHLDRCSNCQRRAERFTDHSAWSTELEWLSPSTAAIQTSELSPEREPTLFLTPPESHQVTSETAFWGGRESGRDPEKPRSANSLIPRWRELEERFEIRETVGIGGCGTVFRAWDRRLHRQVALKVPHWPLFAQEAIRQRFAVEARAAARLSHPNIVPIFEAQIDSDVCFLASEFIEGRSLAAWLAERRFAQQTVTCRLAAALVRELALGVEAAHAQGILHRDLKPANVLLDLSRSQDELEFVPRITDFGLARLSEEAGPTTVEGSVIGSLPYMSPEQAAGGGKQLNAGCDIYPLGVVLYEALTGNLPILGTSPPDLLQRIASQLPTEPRRLRPEIPPDLQAICLKCLEKRPQDRYLTARELAADLSRFLAGETVIARRPSLPEQLVRWVRRHPTATTVVAVNFAALTVVALVLAVANRQLSTMNVDLEAAVQMQREATGRADVLRDVADTQRTAALEQLYVAEVRRAAQSWRDRDLPELQSIVDKLARPEFEPFRSLEWNWFRRLLDFPSRELTRLPGAVYAVSLSSTGDRVAVTGQHSVVRIVDFPTGRTVGEWPTGQRECNDAVFADRDLKLWTTGDDGSLCQWDIATQECLVRLSGHAPDQAHNLLTVPEEDLLISAGTDGKLRHWSLSSGAMKQVVDAHQRAVLGLSLLADRRQLLTLGRESQVAVWNLKDAQPIFTWDMKRDSLRAVAPSRDGSRLIASTADRRVTLYDIAPRQRVASAQLLDVIDCLTVAPSNGTVFAADRQGVIHAFSEDPAQLQGISDDVSKDSRSTQGVLSLVRAHTDRIYDLQLTADDSELISAGADGQVRVWPVTSLDGHHRTLRSAEKADDFVCLPGSSRILTVTETELGWLDAEFRAVPADGPPVGPVPGADYFSAVAVTPGGAILSAESDQRRERNWLVLRDGRTGNPLSTWHIAAAAQGVANIRTDSEERLAVISRHSLNRLQFVDLTTGVEEPAVEFEQNVSNTAISPRTAILAASIGLRVVLLTPRTRELRWLGDTLPQAIQDLRFSADGRFLAAASSDRGVWVWEVASGRLQNRLTGHRQEVTSVEFAPDGRTLISGDASGVVKLWRLTTGDHLCDLNMDVSGTECAKLRIHPFSGMLVMHCSDSFLVGAPLSPTGRR